MGPSVWRLTRRLGPRRVARPTLRQRDMSSRSGSRYAGRQARIFTYGEPSGVLEGRAERQEHLRNLHRYVMHAWGTGVLRGLYLSSSICGRRRRRPRVRLGPGETFCGPHPLRPQGVYLFTLIMIKDQCDARARGHLRIKLSGAPETLASSPHLKRDAARVSSTARVAGRALCLERQGAGCVWSEARVCCAPPVRSSPRPLRLLGAARGAKGGRRRLRLRFALGLDCAGFQHTDSFTFTHQTKFERRERCCTLAPGALLDKPRAIQGPHPVVYWQQHSANTAAAGSQRKCPCSDVASPKQSQGCADWDARLHCGDVTHAIAHHKAVSQLVHARDELDAAGSVEDEAS